MNEITEKIIGAAIEVHKALGPGLLESAYEVCLAHELSLAKFSFERQVPVPLRYKSIPARLRVSTTFCSTKKSSRGAKSRRGVATYSPSASIDLSEARRLADRIAYQLQRPRTQEGHQTLGAHSSVNFVSLRCN